MKKRTLSLVAMMATLALTSPLYATGNNQSNTTMMNQGQEMQVGQNHSLSAEKLVGMTIESKDGENIGEIQDLKIDTSTGRINYITVQVGGVLGIGGKDGVAVPLEAFRFADDKAILTVDQSKLNDVPDRANMTEADFQRGLESHYGVSPAWRDNRIDASPQGSTGINPGDTNSMMENSNSKDKSNHMNNLDNQQHKKMAPLSDTSDNQKSQ